jgi:hypothetical protein
MVEAVTRGVGGSAAWYGRQSLPVAIPRQSLGTEPRNEEKWGVGSGESNEQEE